HARPGHRGRAHPGGCPAHRYRGRPAGPRPPGTRPVRRGRDGVPLQRRSGAVRGGAGPMRTPRHVVTAGVARFAEALAAQGTPHTPVAWQPPPDGSVDDLVRVLADPRRVPANAEATRWMLAAGAKLVDVRPAGEVVGRVRWMGDVLGPALQAAVRAHGPVDVKALVGQMLTMGDEGHNRNRAGTLMLLRDLLPDLVESGLPSPDVARVARFIGGNDHFFLNLVMPAAK